MGTASPVEIAWTAVAIVGLLTTANLANRSYRYWRAVQASRQVGYGGYRVRTARNRIVNDCLGIAYWIGFIVIGVLAMLTPPPVREANQHSAVIEGNILVAIEIILLVRALMNEVDRRAVDRRLELEDRLRRVQASRGTP